LPDERKEIGKLVMKMSLKTLLPFTIVGSEVPKAIYIIAITFLTCLLSPIPLIQSETPANIILPIASQDFIKPVWNQDKVVINSGDLGRYRFSPESIPDLPDNVKIRPELIKLLNDLQREFNAPMIIMSGYLSQKQNLYVWARWLNDNPQYIEMLNEKGLKSWDEWVDASQKIPGGFQIASKYQTGDAVDFYWKGLDFQTEKKRDAMIKLLNEIGGSRKYTEEDRQKYNIAKDDDNLLKITGYMPGERITFFNPWGYCYFHAEYQPSEMPLRPDINAIGTKLSDLEDEDFAYKSGEVILIEDSDFAYVAETIEESKINDLEVKAYIYCDEVREKTGDKVLKNRILTRRVAPEGGWGTRKVMLEYYHNGGWNFSMDVVEYEDYYMVPLNDGTELKIVLKNVRFPIPRIH